MASKGSVLSKAGASSIKAPRVVPADSKEVVADTAGKLDPTGTASLPATPWAKESSTAAEKLESVQDQSGLVVDKRTLQGRRENRGFTVSVGTGGNSLMTDNAMMRANRRAQTHTGVESRRGDFAIPEEAKVELAEKSKHMQARKRRGSVSIGEVAPDEEITTALRESTTCFVHGLNVEGQAHMDEREWSFLHDQRRLPGSISPTVMCQKGSKGHGDKAPNQDNFSISYFKNGYTMATVMDGHGPFGHIVSHRCVRTVPFYLSQSPSFPSNMKEALIEAFETAQADLVGHALQNSWDVQASGSTAIAAIWKGNKLWTANVGDSRCIIGSETERKLLFETEDHKPQDAKEKARIESRGGEVRSKTYPDGWVNHRIFVKGATYPGLCMARTFGDESVKAHGVIATPEVAEVTLDMDKKPFIILASDGVWEFMDSQFVIKAMSKKISTDGPKTSIQKLQREAQKRWRDEEQDYCDDITSMLIQLR